jgi:HEAT repeat protein
VTKPKTASAAQRAKDLRALSERDPSAAIALAVAVFAEPRARSAVLRAAAAGALGAMPTDAAFEALRKALDDEVEEVRAAALESLGRSTHPESASLLVAICEASERAIRGQQHSRAFGDYQRFRAWMHRRDAESERYLVARVLRDEPDASAIQALNWSSDPALIDRLRALVSHPRAGDAARSALVWRGGAVAFDALASLLTPAALAASERSEEIASSVLLSLWCHDDRHTTEGGEPRNDPRWAEVALELVHDERDEVAHGAGILVKQLRHPRLVPSIIARITSVLRGETKSTRALAELASALGALGDRRAVPTLCALATAENVSESARWYAARALCAIGDRAALPTLRAVDAAGNGADKALREAIAEIERTSE